MRSESSILFSALCSVVLVSACNPCDIEVVSDTAFIAPNCPVVTTADDTTGNSEATGDATTIASDSSTGEPMCTVDEDCGPNEFCDWTKFPYVCEPLNDTPCVWTNVPAAGEAWGPCNADDACTADSVFCQNNGAAEVCLPACDGGECPAAMCNGVCLNNGECVSECVADSDCPFPGMVCSLAADTLTFCGWPL